MTPGPLTTGLDEKGYYVTTGHGSDLMDASKNAVRYMIEHLEMEHKMTRQEAYALSSVAVDLKISEIVDVPNYLISAYLPRGIFK